MWRHSIRAREPALFPALIAPQPPAPSPSPVFSSYRMIAGVASTLDAFERVDVAGHGRALADRAIDGGDLVGVEDERGRGHRLRQMPAVPGADDRRRHLRAL